MTSTCKPSFSKKPFSLAITIGAQSVNLMKPILRSVFSSSKSSPQARCVCIEKKKTAVKRIDAAVFRTK
jgi:hypothetical protein